MQSDNSPDLVNLWWRAARPYSFPASIVPAVLGTAIAWSQGFRINWFYAVLVFFGVVIAHTGANLTNDYVDFIRGYDRKGTLGGSGVLVDEFVPPRTFLFAALLCFAVALILGLPMLISRPLPVLILMLFGIIAAVGYVSPPFNFKYRAFGDAAVFAAFGAGITVGAYIVQTGNFSWFAVAYSIPYGLWVVALLHSNNIRDMADDSGDGFRTFAGILGPRRARFAYAAIVFLSYAFVAIFAAARVFPWSTLVVFLTLLVAVGLTRDVFSPQGSPVLAAAVPKTAQFSLFFGVSLIAGALLGRVFGL